MLKRIRGKKGFTLVEVILVMGIAAILMIGVFTIYDKVSTSVKIKRQVEAIMYIKSEVNSMYASKNSYEGLYFQTGTVSYLKGVSSEMANLKLFTSILVMAEAINGKENTGFMMSMSNLQKEECIKIVSSLPYANFVSIRVNDATVYNKMKNTTGNVEFDIANASIQCSSKDKNSVALDNP